MVRGSITKPTGPSTSSSKPVKTRKLTEFFPKASGQSSSPPGSSPINIATSNARVSHQSPFDDPHRGITSETRQKPSVEHEVTSVNSASASHISISSGSTNLQSVTYISSDSYHHHSPVPSSHLKPPTRVGPGKLSTRSGTPEVPIVAAPRKPSPAKVSNKRKQMFDIESDIEVFDTVIRIPKTPIAAKENLPVRLSPAKGSPSKRQKSLSLRSVHYVPSSQSDEQELAVPKSPRDLALVKETVHKWRNGTEQDQCDPDDDVNVPLSNVGPVSTGDTAAYLPSPNSELDHATHSNPRSSVTFSTPAPPDKHSPSPTLVDDYLPPSPPPSDPLAVDPADVIARFKAEAIQKAAYEEETRLNASIHTSDLSSESDLSDDDLFRLKDSPKRESLSVQEPKASSSRSSYSPSTSRRSRRLMDRSPSPADSSLACKAPNLPPLTSRRRNAPSNGPIMTTAGLQRNRRAANPLTKMLKEKEKADSHGYGARAVLAAGDLSDSENELEELDLKRLVVATSDVDMDVDEKSPSEKLNDARVEELLGVEDGQAVGKILNHDRGTRKSAAKTIGLDFFHSHHEVYKKAPRSTYIANLLPEDVNDPVFKALKEAVHIKDPPKIKAFLDAGCFSRINVHNMNVSVQWLLDQTFTPSETNLEVSAYQVLSMASCAGCCLYPESLLSILLRMGADANYLSEAGFKVPPDSTQETIHQERRSILTHRLLSFISRIVREGEVHDVAGTIVSLLLIALDKTSDTAVEQLAIVAIDEVGRSLTPATELEVCTQVAKLASEMSPQNQSHLLSLLVGGCAPVVRISRWTSLALLIGVDVLPHDHLDYLLPMAKIARLLAAPFDSGEIFDIHNSEKKDYEDLCCHIAMLGVALSDIHRQAKEEIKLKTKFTVEFICNQMAALHGNIVDTRAAHLDRSRAKAALQSLSFRVRYQMLAVKHNTQTTLESYGKKK